MLYDVALLRMFHSRFVLSAALTKQNTYWNCKHSARCPKDAPFISDIKGQHKRSSTNDGTLNSPSG